MAKVWNVEINTLNEANKTSEWRKIGVNLVWSQVLELKRKYKGFMTRHVVADNHHPECPDCHAFGGHWLSCKSANVLAMRGTTQLAPDNGQAAVIFGEKVFAPCG